MMLGLYSINFSGHSTVFFISAFTYCFLKFMFLVFFLLRRIINAFTISCGGEHYKSKKNAVRGDKDIFKGGILWGNFIFASGGCGDCLRIP
jgi:hypothetical protein